MKLVSNFKHLARQAPIAAHRALIKTGEDVADLASQLAPVDTGALRDSYRSEVISESEIQIGSELDYAVYQEFGTSEIPAQPHLTPAFHQAESTFPVNLLEEIKKEI